MALPTRPRTGLRVWSVLLSLATVVAVAAGLYLFFVKSTLFSSKPVKHPHPALAMFAIAVVLLIAAVLTWRASRTTR